MGRIAGEQADVVVVTDDNARAEDPAAIRRAILAGCPNGVEVADRRAAVRTAWERLSPGDVLVVAGRGDEAWQDLCGQRIPLDDRELLRDLIATASGGQDPSRERTPTRRPDR